MTGNESGEAKQGPQKGEAQSRGPLAGSESCISPVDPQSSVMFGGMERVRR